MDILGVISKKPSTKSGKPDYIHIEYDTLEEYCEATTKIMDILYKRDAEGKCFVKDAKGTKYELDIIHAHFNTPDNRITVYPYKYQEIVPTENKTKAPKNKNSAK